jgi:hypothetical protein
LPEVPYHIIIDRCYIYASPTQQVKRGIALNSAQTDIVNNYIAGFKVVGQEAQGIAGWNGPGPFRIINNYVEAAGENLIFGGATGALPNLVPSDIEIKRNYFFKPPSWRGQFTVKNILELKNAQRVVIEGNLFENCWLDGQNGFAILFTPRPNDSGPAAVVQDVQFVNNILKNAAQGVNLLGIDDIGCPTGTPDCRGRRLWRVLIANNLFQGIGAFDGLGVFVQVLSGTEDVTVDHNTAVLHTGNGLFAEGQANTGFIFKNNLLRRNTPDHYGILGNSYGEGVPSLNQYFPNADVRKNLIYGVTEVDGVNCSRPDRIGCYPANNFYPPDSTYSGTFEGLFVNYANGNYRLAAGSPYKNAGTDGKDVGADQDAIEAAMNQPNTAQSVIWTNLVNATATGNTLQKTSGCDGCPDAGATSQQAIASGDGYFEFTVSSVAGQRFAGLSNGNDGTSWTEIDFAFRLWGSGDLDVQENGVYRSLGATYAVGDVLRVAVEGGVVKYYKNGTLTYTSTVAPVYPLQVDTALLNTNSAVSNAVIKVN